SNPGARSQGRTASGPAMGDPPRSPFDIEHKSTSLRAAALQVDFVDLVRKSIEVTISGLLARAEDVPLGTRPLNEVPAQAQRGMNPSKTCRGASAAYTTRR
ncbi:hypothetical protein, partial [Streptomyces diastatochromogenes]|uniref:hypothetical protein n=1 Tax=Streptomyces diastatochromogenes TaxID=42236 RepID=UPI00368D4984